MLNGHCDCWAAALNPFLNHIYLTTANKLAKNGFIMRLQIHNFLTQTAMINSHRLLYVPHSDPTASSTQKSKSAATMYTQM